MELFLACDQGSLVGLDMEDNKSLCASVTICATQVNIQTHIQTDITLTNYSESQKKTT